MNALWIAKDLSEYIETRGPLTCHVHSTFKEALNLIDDQGELIAVLPEQKGIAPMSLITTWPQAQIARIAQNDLVFLTRESVNFPRTGIKIDSQHAISISCEVDIEHCCWSMCVLETNLIFLKERLIKVGDGNGLLPLIHCFDLQMGNSQGTILDSNTYCEFIQDVFMEIIKLLKRGDYEGIREWLPRFVGFGPGLTPSTDDFLAGIMISMAYKSALNNETIDALSEEIYRSSVGKTTKVSEMMLKRAAKGQVASLYRDVLRSLFMPNPDVMHQQIESVIETGATSGTDFLLGVYCFLSLVVQESKHKGGIEYGIV